MKCCVTSKGHFSTGLQTDAESSKAVSPHFLLSTRNPHVVRKRFRQIVPPPKMKSAHCLVLWVVALACSAFVRIGYTQTAGSVDTTFHPVITGTTEGINAAVLQPDGKIIVNGFFVNTVGTFIVDGTPCHGPVRLNADGSLDTSFALDPSVSVPQFGFSLCLQPDGKIIITGAFTIGTVGYRLARLNADGSLDGTFAPYDPPYEVASGVLQPDGKFVAGLVGSIATVMRFNADGSVDEGFAQGLRIEDDIFQEQVFLATPVVQPDGKIIVGGAFDYVNGVTTNNIVRLNADGSVDTTFNASVYPGDAFGVYEMALQADGKIVIAGNFPYIEGSQQPYVARLESNGTIDPSFNSAIGPNYKASALAIQPDGKIVVGGNFELAIPGEITSAELARLNADGSLDTNFAFDVVNGTIPTGIIVQPDGNIIVYGDDSTSTGGTPQYGVVRLYGAAVVPGPAITSATSVMTHVGQPFSYQITATNSPTSYNGSNLPVGLAVDNTAGLISGTLTQVGSFSITLSAANAGGTGTATLDLTVAEAVPTVTIAALGDGDAVEGGAAGKAAVQRTGDTSAALTVLYKVVGSAKSGVEYKPLTGSVTIPAGASKAKVKIKPINNDLVTDTLVAKIKLKASPTGSYQLGISTVAKIKVLDNN